MNAVIAWFAENRVAANLLMVFILVAGALTLPDTRKEVLPNVSLNVITVGVPYPGASPSQVEEAVSSKVERAIQDMDGVKMLYSRSREHGALVTIETQSGADRGAIFEEIKARVNAINFPRDVGDPQIRDVAIKTLVGKVIVYGDADARTLKNIASSIKEDLAEYDSITQAVLGAVSPYEISIEVSENQMQRYGLSFAELVGAIKRQSLDIPIGDVDTGLGSSSTIFLGQATTKEQFEDLVLRSMPDGGRVLIGDVAEVVDGFARGVTQTEFNGKPAVNIRVYRVGKQNILDIAEDMRSYIKNPRTYLPEGIELAMWQDSSVYFKSRIDLLVENAVGGLLLLFAILMVFLRLRLSFWVSLGIPISFMGAFWLLPMFDGSINMISLFAFILVLGIVVDDAIIVGENIFTHQRAGNPGLKGAIAGAQEVASPVIFAVLTTMVMFSPLLFLPGPEGKLMYVIPVVVISILLFSLIESLLILPAHLSGIKDVRETAGGLFGVVQAKFSNGLESFIENRYRPLLEKCLQWRYSVVSIFLALFLICVAIMGGGWVKMVFFSSIEADLVYANVAFAKGTKMEVTEQAVKKVEEAAQQLKRELNEGSGSAEITNILTQYGAKGTARGEHLGNVTIELTPSEDRTYSGEELTNRWRELVGEIEDVVELSFESTLNKPGPEIDITLTAGNVDALRAAADGLKVQLSTYEGVYGIKDSHQKGKEEVRLHLLPVANELGVKLDEVATQVRQAFQGMEVQRIQRGDDEVKVYVRFPEDERSSLWYLENMQILLPTRTSVPLSSIAEVEYGVGPATIHRVNSKRIIRVQAYVDKSVNTPNNVMADLKSGFLKSLPQEIPGTSWMVSGSQRHKDDFVNNLKKGFALAVLVMYILMATLFRSYTQPLMVMYAIPYGIVGALLGHLALGLDVSLWSLIGMTAVSGVVVNDNLVLVDYINRKRAQGVALSEAIRDAGAARFRPIVLTSMTTFGGLTPLMLEKSVQAQFLIPMAVSLAFGVVFATLVSLILVPSAYHILDDFHEWLAKILPESWFAKYEIEDEVLVATPAGNMAIPAETAVQMEVNEQFRTVLDEPEGDIPILATDHVAGSSQPEPPKEDSGDWNDRLEQAYEHGFEQGRQGHDMDCPHDSEELEASWEAGWDDGHEAYQLSQQQL